MGSWSTRAFSSKGCRDPIAVALERRDYLRPFVGVSLNPRKIADDKRDGCGGKACKSFFARLSSDRQKILFLNAPLSKCFVSPRGHGGRVVQKTRSPSPMFSRPLRERVRVRGNKIIVHPHLCPLPSRERKSVGARRGEVLYELFCL